MSEQKPKDFILRVAKFFELHGAGYFRNTNQINPLQVLLETQTFLEQHPTGTYKTLHPLSTEATKMSFLASGSETVNRFRPKSVTDRLESARTACKKLPFFSKPATDFKVDFSTYLTERRGHEIKIFSDKISKAEARGFDAQAERVGALYEELSKLKELSELEENAPSKWTEDFLSLAPFMYDSGTLKPLADTPFDIAVQDKKLETSEDFSQYIDAITTHFAVATPQPEAATAYFNALREKSFTTVSKDKSAEKRLMLEEVPLAEALLRSYLNGDDCSSVSSFLYAALPGSRVFTLRDENAPVGQALGFAFVLSVPYEDSLCPYIVTMNGRDLSTLATKMFTRSICEVYEQEALAEQKESPSSLFLGNKPGFFNFQDIHTARAEIGGTATKVSLPEGLAQIEAAMPNSPYRGKLNSANKISSDEIKNTTPLFKSEPLQPSNSYASTSLNLEQMASFEKYLLAARCLDGLKNANEITTLLVETLQVDLDKVKILIPLANVAKPTSEEALKKIHNHFGEEGLIKGIEAQLPIARAETLKNVRSTALISTLELEKLQVDTANDLMRALKQVFNDEAGQPRVEFDQSHTQEFRLILEAASTLEAKERAMFVEPILEYAKLEIKQNDMRIAIVSSLTFLKGSGFDKELLDRALIYCGDEYLVVRDVACTTLASYKGVDDKAVVLSLLKLCGDKEEGVRRAAYEALASYKGVDDKAVVSGLLNFCGDKHWSVRFSACTALASYKGVDNGVYDKAIVSSLLKLCDRDWCVRRAACTALASYRGVDDKAVVLNLLKLCGDDGKDVRKAACTALASYTGINDELVISTLEERIRTETDSKLLENLEKLLTAFEESAAQDQTQDPPEAEPW